MMTPGGSGALASVSPEMLRAYLIEELKIVHGRIDDEYKRYNETFLIVVTAIGAIALGLLAAIASEKITLSRQGILLVALLALAFSVAGCLKAVGHMHRIRRHDFYLATYLEPALAGASTPTLTRYWFGYARTPMPLDRADRNAPRALHLFSTPKSLEELTARGWQSWVSVNRWALWILLIGLTAAFAVLAHMSPEFIEGLIVKERKPHQTGSEAIGFDELPALRWNDGMRYRSI